MEVYFCDRGGAGHTGSLTAEIMYCERPPRPERFWARLWWRLGAGHRKVASIFIDGEEWCLPGYESYLAALRHKTHLLGR